MHLGIEVKQPQYAGVWARERPLGGKVEDQPYQEIAHADEITFTIPSETGGAKIIATPIKPTAAEIGSRHTVAIHTDALGMRLRIVGASGGMTILEGVVGFTIEPTEEEEPPTLQPAG